MVIIIIMMYIIYIYIWHVHVHTYKDILYNIRWLYIILIQLKGHSQCSANVMFTSISSWRNAACSHVVGHKTKTSLLGKSAPRIAWYFVCRALSSAARRFTYQQATSSTSSSIRRSIPIIEAAVTFVHILGTRVWKMFVAPSPGSFESAVA